MHQDTPQETMLFSPLRIRDLELANRIVISPMATYSALDGVATDWHLSHYGKFATGGAGTVMVEATAVEDRGRITHGCLGLWRDDQAAALARVASFLKNQGAVPAIQLAHGGRKASAQRPWHGNGPLQAADQARGEYPWAIVAPTDEPASPDWHRPHALGVAEIAEVVAAWAAAAARAHQAGFELLEIHGAHGYLIHSFLSPLSNRRTDQYGGNFTGRSRLALEIIAAVRAVWPQEKPLLFRVSAIDGDDAGWLIEDSIAFAGEAKRLGVDVIDCSSGGIAALSSPAQRALARKPGFQVPLAEQIRQHSGVPTMAIGLILDGKQAEQILRNGQADLIGIAREALYNPHWALHAAQALGIDPGFTQWPDEYGWWLSRRAKTLEKFRAEEKNVA